MDDGALERRGCVTRTSLWTLLDSRHARRQPVHQTAIYACCMNGVTSCTMMSHRHRWQYRCKRQSRTGRKHKEGHGQARAMHQDYRCTAHGDGRVLAHACVYVHVYAGTRARTRCAARVSGNMIAAACVDRVRRRVPPRARRWRPRGRARPRNDVTNFAAPPPAFD